MDRTVAEGALLWEPSEQEKAGAEITRYLDWLAERGKAFGSYPQLWEWSVTDLEGFWESVWDYFEVTSHRPYEAVIGRRDMPGTEWFPGAHLNYAEHALRRLDDHPAVLARSETRPERSLTYAQLGEQVAAAAAGLRRLGVGRGDRVAAYLPNIPETLVAFLATASLGATWSSCAPEFGIGSVAGRFAQLEPRVLLAVDGYRHGGKVYDRREAVTEIGRRLPGLEATVIVPYLAEDLVASRWSRLFFWEELLAETSPLGFEPVPFDHPLWVLFSSGTTGPPKGIVHGHGGVLLELYKMMALHSDLGPEDRFFWYTTTGWMMWNYLVAGLLVGATVVMYDGSPAHPDLSTLWKLAADSDITYFGISAPFIQACSRAGLEPGKELDLGRLRAVGSTGAPLSPEGFAWVYEHVKEDLLLGSVSGGTDLCTAFVCSCPLLPVRAGELQCRALGAKVEAYDEQGRSVIDRVGELVITEPMPSMPVSFWNDPSGERYREGYFESYPGVWRHGDWIKITPRGSCVIYGRSDSTLNRGGVRMGTSEFYRVVEELPEVTDSLVVDTGRLGEEGLLLLFVVLRDGVRLDEKLHDRITEALRTELSPRHVPDEIHAIPDVPRTLSGKKLEIPVKKILTGSPAEEAARADSLANPKSLEFFVKLTAGPPSPSGGGSGRG
ncbi:MAG: acetoacetate--CoA ligase [Acidimicrobiia bacterium]